MDIEQINTIGLFSSPIGIIVLKNTTISEKFYNKSHKSLNAIDNEEKELHNTIKHFKVFMESAIKLYKGIVNNKPLSRDILNSISDINSVNSVVNILTSKAKYADKYFFISKEKELNLIYLDSSIYEELKDTTGFENNLRHLYKDESVEYKLITKWEI